MAFRGSFSRSLISTIRASTFRSSPSISAPRLRPPPTFSAPRPQPRRLSFSNPREERKRWVMSPALPNIQRQDSDMLYLNILLDKHEKYSNDVSLLIGVSCKNFMPGKKVSIKK